MDRFLFRHIDNSPLVVFRIIFGLLLFLESWGAIITGWVERTLIAPQFTFTFIGFEFLQPLPGWGMYYYYILMGIFGFCVMIGYRYRLSMTAFFLMWSATYLMQKTSYNNHYYLTMLLSFLMIFLPANSNYSLDAKRLPGLRSNSVPFWTSLVLILQIGLVYFYGGIAKTYPDWLQAIPARIFLASKANFPLIGDFLNTDWFPYFLSYGGLLFDLFIVPLLLFKRTRIFGFGLSLFFHLFNAIVFQVGIFPFLSLAFAVFFFSPKVSQGLFFKKKTYYDKNEVHVPKYKKVLIASLCLYFVIQFLLPLRHWVIKDNVLWTEEGHRLSWRMMLRSRTGRVNFTVVNKADQKAELINLRNYLTRKQQRRIGAYPDFIWQFAQHLKAEYAEKGVEIEVFADARVSINGRPPSRLIDPDVDLAAIAWDPLRHHHWILPAPWESGESKD